MEFEVRRYVPPSARFTSPEITVWRALILTPSLLRGGDLVTVEFGYGGVSQTTEKIMRKFFSKTWRWKVGERERHSARVSLCLFPFIPFRWWNGKGKQSWKNLCKIVLCQPELIGIRRDFLLQDRDPRVPPPPPFFGSINGASRVMTLNLELVGSVKRISFVIMALCVVFVMWMFFTTYNFWYYMELVNALNGHVWSRSQRWYTDFSSTCSHHDHHVLTSWPHVDLFQYRHDGIPSHPI